MSDCIDNFPEGDVFIYEHFEFMVPYDEGNFNVFSCSFHLSKPFFKLQLSRLCLLLFRRKQLLFSKSNLFKMSLSRLIVAYKISYTTYTVNLLYLVL